MVEVECKNFRLIKATNHRTTDTLAVSRYLSHHTMTGKILERNISVY